MAVVIIIHSHTANAQMRLLVSDVYADNNILDLSNANAKINNSTRISEDIEIQVFNDRYGDMDNLLTESRPFTVNQDVVYVSFNEIFDGLRISLGKEPSTTISFKIINARTRVQMAFYTVNILNQKVNRETEKPQGLLHLSGNAAYKINKSVGQVDSLNLADYNALEFNTELSVADIPFRINGLVTDFRDPFLDYNLSNFSSYFDVQKWKEKQKNKVKQSIDRKANQVFNQIPGYDAIKERDKYLEKVLANEAYIEDVARLDEGIRSLDSLGEYGKQQLEREINNDRRMLQRLYDQIKEESDQSNLDSLNEVIDTLENKVDKLYNLKDLRDKKETYTRLVDLKDSCSQILQRAEQTQQDIAKYKNDVLDSPSRLNAHLSEKYNTGRIEKLLNYVSDLRYGLINPDYSEHVLRGSRNEGITFGVGGKSWDAHVFQGKTISRNIAYNSDSIKVVENKLVGAKLKLNAGEIWSNKMFIVSSISDNELISDHPQSIIGFGTKIDNEKRLISFETAWSRNSAKANDDKNGFEKTVANLALDFKYEVSNQKKTIKWENEINYIAPEYNDFNNPFLFRNHVDITSRLGLKSSRYLNSSINIYAQKANIWDNTSNLNHRLMLGTNHTYSNPALPSLSYALQVGYMNVEDNSVWSQLHNINSFYNYKIFNQNAVSILNVNIVSNSTNVDTLNVSNVNIAFNQNYSISSIFDLNIGVNYLSYDNGSEYSSRDFTLEFSMPVTYKSLFLNCGIKRLQINQESALAWFCQLRLEALKNLFLNINLDSQQRSSFVNEQGIVSDSYFARYTGTISYNF